ncbi:hypothetical protein [Streptomyces sp. NBC_01423]|uniref:hypothetical protein n=1 Tax=Streptomyces sp. NBC_01423 TaxID=2903860 RepID=UPI002E2A4901|nr:hypothetical protein [Streptomyces sp. NBC_01423]
MNEPLHPAPGQARRPIRQPDAGHAPAVHSPSVPAPPRMPPGAAFVRRPEHGGGQPDMPQRVKSARIVLFLLAGSLIVLCLAALAQADAAQSSLAPYNDYSGLMASALEEAEQKAAAQMALAQAGVVQGALYAAVAVALAARFGKGGNALRVGTVVFGAWHCVVGLFTLGVNADISPASGMLAALFEVAAGVSLIIIMSLKESVLWFSRPRH